jgi:hypothetical protein
VDSRIAAPGRADLRTVNNAKALGAAAGRSISALLGRFRCGEFGRPIRLLRPAETITPAETLPLPLNENSRPHQVSQNKERKHVRQQVHASHLA